MLKKINIFTFFEVGGKVRDEILGVMSKDVDFVAVPNDEILKTNMTASSVFNILVDYLKSEKFIIFQITPDCYTIRARFPQDHKYDGVADFVMARKEIGYVPNTRTPIIMPGTLYDDLARRDFTLNAMAKDDADNLIDFFNGYNDLMDGILRTPLDTQVTFDDDPLRILRAIRFSITKGFIIPDDMKEIIRNYDIQGKMHVVSDERIREELLRCFKWNTLMTIEALNQFPKLKMYVFKNIWLKPTFEK